MKNKNKLSTDIKKDYSKIPMKVMRLGLPMDSLALLVYLISLPETFNPSRKHLCNYTGWSKRKVRKYFTILETCSIIKCVKSSGTGRIARYAFCKVNDWKVYKGI